MAPPGRRRLAARLFAAAGLVSLLSSCSYAYDLEVVGRGGRVVFQPKEKQGSGCLADFTVVARDGTEMWRIDSGRYIPTPCENRFPLVYGAAPPGLREEVPAKPLTPGAYTVEGWDGDSYEGRFLLTREGRIVDLGVPKR